MQAEVKKLKWWEHEPERYHASSIVGLYQVFDETVGVWAGRWVVGLDRSIIDDCADQAAAKASAQADFDRRIRSALVPPSPTEE